MIILHMYQACCGKGFIQLHKLKKAFEKNKIYVKSIVIKFDADDSFIKSNSIKYNDLKRNPIFYFPKLNLKIFNSDIDDNKIAEIIETLKNYLIEAKKPNSLQPKKSI